MSAHRSFGVPVTLGVSSAACPSSTGKIVATFVHVLASAGLLACKSAGDVARMHVVGGVVRMHLMHLKRGVGSWLSDELDDMILEIAVRSSFPR